MTPILRRIIGMMGQGVPKVYATWNPSDKDAAIVLSSGNLLATDNTATVAKVRSTVGKASGKWYWEVTFSSGGTGNTNVGVAGLSGSTSTYVGANTDSWGIFGSTVYNNAASTGISVSPVPAIGDILGLALDCGAGTLQYYINNVSAGSAVTGLSGTLYAAVGNVGGTGNSFTANFGATALAYSPPSGFNAGLYV